MTNVVRWIFADDSGSYTVPINPNQMSKLHFAKDLRTMGNATLAAPKTPIEWTFGGVIRTEQHYQDLLLWSRKSAPITITDHYGRSIECILTKFEPQDRTPTPTVPWRYTYTMTALVLSVLEV